MLCEKCHKNNATIKIVKNINGNITEQYLCQSCANSQELGFHDFTKDNPFNSLFNIFSPAITSDYLCPECNTSYKEFKQTGKLGCGECFIKFENYLDEVFKNFHGSTTHTGKIPKRCGEHLKIKKQKENLKALLNKAILDENYEEAARIRDEIRGMEA